MFHDIFDYDPARVGTILALYVGPFLLAVGLIYGLYRAFRPRSSYALLSRTALSFVAAGAIFILSGRSMMSWTPLETTVGSAVRGHFYPNKELVPPYQVDLPAETR